MLSLLVPLLLALPQDRPTAVEYLPADTIGCIQLSFEPYDRLGAQTAVGQLFAQPDLADALAPLHQQAQAMLDEASMQLGVDLPALLKSSRFHFAVSQTTILEGGGPLVFAADLDPKIAAGLNLGELLNEMPVGAWWQNGTVVLGVIDADEMERPNPEDRDRDVSYLQQLVANVNKGGPTMTGLAGWKAMHQSMGSSDDLFSAWLLVENIDRAFIEEVAGEEMPPEVEDIMNTFGLDKIQGVGWTMTVTPPMFEDRFLVYGPGFGSRLFPSDMLAVTQLTELLKFMPHDAARTNLLAMDFQAGAEMLMEVIETIAAAEGQSIDDLPEGAQDGIAIAMDILNQVGPVMGSCTRMDDFEQAAPGDVWLQVRDADKMNAVLDRLPEGIRETLAEGMVFTPGTPPVKLVVDGSRLRIFESVAPAASEQLRTQLEFLPAAEWMAQFNGQPVAMVDFTHRDVLVNGLATLRDRGNDLIGMTEVSDFPFDFHDLPEDAVLRNLMQPMASVGVVDQRGLYYEMRSPFGATASSLVAGFGQVIEIMDTFGLLLQPALNEEEF